MCDEMHHEIELAMTQKVSLSSPLGLIGSILCPLDIGFVFFCSQLVGGRRFSSMKSFYESSDHCGLP